MSRLFVRGLSKHSIETLAPTNRFVQSVSRIPITPGIPYHSMIGYRGEGDTPNSSDGVVAYWSSHVQGAQSELISRPIKALLKILRRSRRLRVF